MRSERWYEMQTSSEGSKNIYNLHTHIYEAEPYDSDVLQVTSPDGR